MAQDSDDDWNQRQCIYGDGLLLRHQTALSPVQIMADIVWLQERNFPFASPRSPPTPSQNQTSRPAPQFSRNWIGQLPELPRCPGESYDYPTAVWRAQVADRHGADSRGLEGGRGRHEVTTSATTEATSHST